ncbi:MAG TPA: NAD(P)H-dependent glycerol-3-phosphate dehydrogenase [Phaeodactylibacter sp.]|nr:NAD(P)H-dependent glycerol-3-phosphate dehydrogenase [Phaeodactylibacter sp.]
MTKLIGVIGAGSFGTSIAQLISKNVDVLLYARNKDLVHKINTTHEHLGVQLNKNIEATFDPKYLSENCTLIFPIVPSTNFRAMMKTFSPYLRPYHILIHGTKGFDVKKEDLTELEEGKISWEHVHTMSDVIKQESVVKRIGCLSGPNLSAEIMAGQPTATLIASPYDEVFDLGKKVLRSSQFHVFGSRSMLGAEMAGGLKNVYALGSGILGGLGLGKNIQAMLISRGLAEMIYFAKAFDIGKSAFLGTAGIGDLIATATSTDSRNYTFGMRMGQGESLEKIMDTMPELAEGVRTLKIFNHISRKYKIRVPIIQMLYRIVFEGFEVQKALKYLIAYPYDVDVDFL